MQLLKLVFIIIAGLLITVPASKAVMAQQYGQAVTPSRIFIDKKLNVPNDNISDPQNAEFVDNLFDFNSHFKPGQNVFFKIRVKNTSITPLTNVQIKDLFPTDFVQTVGGSGALVRDQDNKLAVIIDAGNLNPDEEKVFFLQFKALFPQQLAGSQTLFCGSQGVINKAQVTTNQGAFDTDNAQFCIEKVPGAVTITAAPTPAQVTPIITKIVTVQTPVVTQVITAEKIPSAGPEMSILLIGGETLTLIAGIYLKKLTS